MHDLCQSIDRCVAPSGVWPALRRPVGVASGFAFAMAVGEFGATVFLSRGALSCVLGLIAALSVALVDRATDDGPAS
jgi:ABC-type Fe3+ transport system permease subunit